MSSSQSRPAALTHVTVAVGCFVAAKRARIAPIDAVYSRMGANDLILAGASTFKVEMDDCSTVLNKVQSVNETGPN